VTLFNLAIDL